MQSAKQAATNIESGMEKTKAVVEEKAEKLTTRDPVKKEMAEQKKEARIQEAERMKHEAQAQNEAAKRGHEYGYGRTGAAGATDYTTGTREHAGYTPEGPVREDYPTAASAVGSQYPAGTNTGSGRIGVQDPRVAGGKNAGYGSASTN